MSTNNQTTKLPTPIQLRKEAGHRLFQDGNVMKVEEELYIVKSQSDESIMYTVENHQCNCPDFAKRGKYYICKHIWSTLFFEGKTTEPEPEPKTVIAPTTKTEDELELQRIMGKKRLVYVD